MNPARHSRNQSDRPQMGQRWTTIDFYLRSWPFICGFKKFAQLAKIFRHSNVDCHDEFFRIEFS
jgi:hypothetical protein